MHFTPLNPPDALGYNPLKLSTHKSEKRNKVRSGVGVEGPSYIFQKQNGTNTAERSPNSAIKS